MRDFSKSLRVCNESKYKKGYEEKGKKLSEEVRYYLHKAMTAKTKEEKEEYTKKLREANRILMDISNPEYGKVSVSKPKSSDNF